MPSAESTLAVDEFACAVLAGTVEGLEANPEKVGAQREKGVTHMVKGSKEDVMSVYTVTMMLSVAGLVGIAADSAGRKMPSLQGGTELV